MRLKFNESYCRFPLPVKATIWFTICNFFIKGINFFASPILTRLLDTEQYGRLSVFMSYDQLILIFATWEIQLGAHQKGLFKYKDNSKEFTSATILLCNIITILFFSFVFVFSKFVTRITELSMIILLSLFMNLLFRPAYYCFLNQKRKAYEYRLGVVITILYSLINVCFPIFAILIMDRTAELEYSVALVSTCILCALIYHKIVDFRVLRKDLYVCISYWKFCIKFEGPLVLHSLSFLVLGQADRVMIKQMTGASQAALYSVAYSIANVVSLFQISLNSSLSPWRYQMLDEKKYDAIRSITNKLLIFIGGIVIVFVLVSPEIIKVLFTPEYYDAIWCISPISISVFFMFLYSAFVNIEEYFEKTKYVVFVSVTCGVINIVLNYCFIGIFGYVVCAYTTLVSYILFAFGHYFFMNRTLRKCKVDEKLIDESFALIVSIFVIVLSICLTLLYSYTIIRYFILLIICLISYIKRTKIYDVINQFNNRQFM